MAKVTVQDIALALGVSTATVSMALHGKPGVSEQVRQTVCKKAEEMGYVVKERMPRKKAQETLTPVFLMIRQSGRDWNREQFFLELLEELERVTGGLLMRSVDAPTESNLRFVREKLAEISQQASYIILLATDLSRETLESLLPLMRCPVIVFDQNCWWLPVHSVAIDNVGSIIDGVRHYKEMGYTRFGFLTSSDRLELIYNFQERQDGFCRAMELLDIPEYQILEVPGGEITEEQKKAFCESLTAQVYFSIQDGIALRAHQLAQETQPGLPDDRILVGYDDSLPRSVSGASFRLNRDIMAKNVADLGTQLVSHPGMAPVHILVRSTLVK